MYRVVKVSSVVYAIKVNLEEDVDNIETCVGEGEVVLLCDDLENVQ